MVQFSKIIIFILLISICTFTNFSAAETASDVKNNLIKVCEYKYEKNSSNLYYCILSQFYALERVLDIIYRHKSQEDIKKLDEILKKHLNKKYDVFDFVEIEKDFNSYLR